MAPVASQLQQRSIDVSFLSLDNYYNQHTNEALKQLTFDYTTLGDSQKTSKWWDLKGHEQQRLIHQAVVEFEAAFARFRPDAIVVGNSLGELEQLAMRSAARFGIIATLIQDGVITKIQPKIGEGQFLPSVLSGPCDILCTWNESQKEFIRGRRTTPQIIACGSPRYDTLATRPTSKRPISPFTVMVATQCYANYRMRKPVDEISLYERIINRILARQDIEKVILRLHPQTNITSRYEEMARRFGSRVALQLGGDSLAAVQEVDCVVATSSTVLVEACISDIAIAELSYLTKHDLETFVRFDKKFDAWLSDPNFPTNFFSSRSKSKEHFLSEFCPVVDGTAAQQIADAIIAMVTDRSRPFRAIENPRCTIITELHQNDALLQLNSILGDKSANIEVIAIDRTNGGQSLSKMQSVFRSDSRLKLKHAPSTNRATAIITAIQESKSEFLIVLDQNSFLWPGSIEFAIETLQAYPQINAFMGATTLAAEEGIISQIVSTSPKETFADFIADQKAAAHSKAVFFRKRGLTPLPTNCPDNEFEYHLINALIQTCSDKRIILSPRVLSCYPYISKVSHHLATEALAEPQPLLAKSKTNEAPPTQLPIPAEKKNSTERLPEFSVLLCSYNREMKIGRCLEALANQTIDKSRYEVICVNDGSTDKTGLEMRRGLEQLNGIYIEHETNKALAAARNTAIAAASGKYLLFINDDTYATPTFLEEHLKTHQLHKGKDIAVAGYLPFIEAYKNRVFSLALMDANLYFGYNGLPTNQALPFWFFITGNLSVGRHLFTKDNIRFDESFIRYGYEDIECGYRLWQKGLNVYYNPQAQAIHDHLLTIENFINREENNAANILQFCAMHPDPILAENLMTTKRLDQAAIKQWSDFVEGSRPRIPEIISQISDVQEIIAQMDSPEARARAQHLIKEVGESTRLVALWVKLNTFLEVFKQHPTLKEVLLSDSWAAQAQKKFHEIGYETMP